MQLQVLLIQSFQVHQIVVLIGVVSLLLLGQLPIELLAQPEFTINQLKLLVVIFNEFLVLKLLN